MKNKKGQFLFWVFISAGIHYVGILSLLIYFIQKRQKTTHLYLYLIVSICVSQTGFIRESILYMCDTGMLPNIIKYYIISDIYGYNLGITHTKTIQQLIVLLFALYLQSNNKMYHLPYFTLIFNVYYLSTISYILLSEVAIFSTRIGAHFYSVEPILLVYLAQRFKQQKVYLVILLLTSLFVAYMNYVYRDIIPSYYMFINNSSYSY